MIWLNPKSSESANRTLGVSIPDGSFEFSQEERLRGLITEAADQLCQIVDGNFDFVVRVGQADDDVDKLVLLVNSVLASARRSLEGLHKANQWLEGDLAAARKLQEKLLPQTLEPVQNLQIGARFVPARAVGGDFFDFFRYQRCGLYTGILADVSGKGAAAAIYAALASGIVRSLVPEELASNEMLHKLNRNLFARAPDGQFVALTYFTWDEERRVLEASNSGLPEPLLCRNGNVGSLPVHGLPLGLFPEAEYDGMRMQCRPGDTLIFYTDGIVDAVDPDGNEFGAERLARVVLANLNNEAQEIVDSVVQEAHSYCRCESNFDDQTVIAMKVL